MSNAADDEPTILASFSNPTVDVRVGVPGTIAAPDRLLGSCYRGHGILGRGGMGEAYDAEHLETGARVVVKLLHHTHARDRSLVERLRREGEMLAVLDHPNVVRVYGAGHAPYGGPFLVMERLIGRSLRDEVEERGALPPLEAIGYVRQALSGIGAVHRAGIVHRDLKLHNLFLCDFLCDRGGDDPRDTVSEGCRAGLGGSGADRTQRLLKILDFGVAKFVDLPKHETSPACPRSTGSVALLTADGVCIGTPRFASPEQAVGRAVDRRADLYALGVVLYVLLTGRALFDDLRDPASLLAAQLHRPPPRPSDRSPFFVPALLDDIVLRALAKDPDHRFADAAAFASALDYVVERWAELAPDTVVDAPRSFGRPIDDAHPEARCRDVDSRMVRSPAHRGGARPATSAVALSVAAVSAFLSGGLIGLAILAVLT